MLRAPGPYSCLTFPAHHLDRLAFFQVVELAQSMAEKKGIKKPTSAWFQLFKKRHPDLVMKLCKKGKRTREPGDASLSEGIADILASYREMPMK